MGCTSSTEILATALYPLAQPVAALNAKFCGPNPVTLHVREKAWTLSGDDFTIRDIHTDQHLFRIDGSAFSMSQHKALVDLSDNQFIAHMRNVFFTFMPEFNICQDRDGCHVLFKIEAKASLFDTHLNIEFRNVASPNKHGEMIRVGMLGDWRARAAVIWIDQGNGQRVPVARIYRPTTSRGIFLGAQDYYVDIAPNMDKALVVLICVALDECKRD